MACTKPPFTAVPHSSHIIASSHLQSRGFHDWELYIIMEYCDRGSLAQMITERALWDATKGQPDLRSILTVARHIAAGMAYLHAKHILHGGEVWAQHCTHKPVHAKWLHSQTLLPSALLQVN
jgi:hypothetical protein